MQGVGWLSIHPIDIEFPLWMGTWLGIYPTVETLSAQLLAFVFVVGSYFAAEWMRKRDLRRAIAAHEESLRETATPPATVDVPVGATNGNGAGHAPGAIGSADDAVPTSPDRLSRR
jgi:hypothetical protein